MNVTSSSNLSDGEHAALGVCTGLATLLSLYVFLFVCGSRLDKIDNLTLRLTSSLLKTFGVTSSKSCLGSVFTLLVSSIVNLILVSPLVLCLLWGGLTVENSNHVISGLSLLTLFPSLGIVFVSVLTWQKSRWHLSWTMIALFGVSYVFLFSFQLVSVLPKWALQYSFSGLAYVFVGLSTSFTLCAMAQVCPAAKVQIQELLEVDPKKMKREDKVDTDIKAFWNKKITEKRKGGICYSPLFRAALLYLCALICLFVFTIVNLHLSHEYSLDTEGIGFAVMGGVVAIDLVIMTLCIIDVLVNLKAIGFTFIVFRFALVSFGSDRWFVGFSLIYFALCAFLGWCAQLEWLNMLRGRFARERDQDNAADTTTSTSATSTTTVTPLVKNDDAKKKNKADSRSYLRRPKFKIILICTLLAVLSILFTILFVITIVYHEKNYSGLRIPVITWMDKDFKQWYFGAAALSMVPVSWMFVFTLATRRLCRTDEDETSMDLPTYSTRTLYIMYAVSWIGLIGVGLFLFLLTEAVMLFAAFLFWPPFFISTIMLYRQLRRRDYRIFDLASNRVPRNLLREGEKGYETAKKWMDTFNAASIEAAKVGKKDETKVQVGGTSVDPWSQVKFAGGNDSKDDDDDDDDSKKKDDEVRAGKKNLIQDKASTTVSMCAGGLCNCSFMFRAFRSGDFQKVSIFSALIRGGATEGDYILSLTFFVGFLSALGYSIMASLAHDTWYPTVVTLTVCEVYYVGLGIVAHFGTLEWDVLSIGSLVLAAVLHCANLGLLFVAWDADTWEATLVRIGMFLSFPAVVDICYVGYQFVDNHYKFTKLMAIQLSILAIPIIFGIVSVGVFSASAAAALSVFVLFLLYLCFLMYSYVSNRFHLSLLQRRVAFAVFGMVMLVGFVFAIASYAADEHKLSFAAGTIAWSVPALVLALYAFGTWYNRSDTSVYCSNVVYPVLHFGQNHSVEDSEEATNATYACILMIITWGGFCAINGEASIELGALAMSGGFVLIVFFTIISILDSKGDIAASLSVLRLVTLLNNLETRQDIVDTLDETKKGNKTTAALPPLFRCLEQSHEKARGVDVLDDVGEIFPSTGWKGMLSSLKTALINDDEEKVKPGEEKVKEAGGDDDSKTDDSAILFSSSTYQSRVEAYDRARTTLDLISANLNVLRLLICRNNLLNLQEINTFLSHDKKKDIETGAAAAKKDDTKKDDNDDYELTQDTPLPKRLEILCQAEDRAEDELLQCWRRIQSYEATFRLHLVASAKMESLQFKSGFSRFVAWCVANGSRFHRQEKSQQATQAVAALNDDQKQKLRDYLIEGMQIKLFDPKNPLTLHRAGKLKGQKLKCLRRLQQLYCVQRKAEMEADRVRQEQAARAEEARRKRIQEAQARRRKEERERREKERRERESANERKRREREEREERERREREEREERERREREEREERERRERGERERRERARREREQRERQERERKEREKKEREEAEAAAQRAKSEKEQREAQQALQRMRKRQQEEQERRQRLERERKEREQREERERKSREERERKKRQERQRKEKEERERKRKQERERKEHRERNDNSSGKKPEVVTPGQHLDSIKRFQEELAQLERYHEKSQTMFRDASFEGESALYVDPSRPDKSIRSLGTLEWLRPSEFNKSAFEVITKGPSEDNFACQGALGDCWLISAIAVLGFHDQKELVRDIVVRKKISKWGIYGVRLCFNGVWTNVVLDDRLPCRYGHPVFVGRDLNKRVKELWPLFIEKAYAKVFGSYESLKGGNSHMALATFTGGFGECLFTQKNKGKIDAASGKLWKDMKKWHDQKHLLACGTPGSSDSTFDDMGLTQSHAYGILRVVEESDSNGTHKLIQVLNPWAKAKGEWQGKWSDNDQKSWSRRMRQRLNYTPNKSRNDGRFYISYEDFIQRFTEVYVCHRFTSDWTLYAMNAAWAEGSNGGFRNLPSCPQFAFKIDRPTNVAICITQGGFNAGGLNGEACVVFSLFGGSSFGGLPLRGRDASSHKSRHVLIHSPYSSAAFHKMNMIEIRLTPDMGGPGGGFTISMGTQKKNRKLGFALKVYSDAKFSMPLTRLNPNRKEAAVIEDTLLGDNVVG